jgi:hypothetical protein
MSRPEPAGPRSRTVKPNPISSAKPRSCARNKFVLGAPEALEKASVSVQGACRLRSGHGGIEGTAAAVAKAFGPRTLGPTGRASSALEAGMHQEPESGGVDRTGLGEGAQVDGASGRRGPRRRGTGSGSRREIRSGRRSRPQRSTPDARPVHARPRRCKKRGQARDGTLGARFDLRAVAVERYKDCVTVAPFLKEPPVEPQLHGEELTSACAYSIYKLYLNPKRIHNGAF